MTLTDQEQIEIYRKMVTIRQFETVAGQLHAEQKLPGFIHLSIGQEASAVGVCSVLRADDYLTTTHRGHGHMIAKGADLNKMVAELFGKRSGYCKGKGGSMHIADYKLGILGANGVVAGGLPIAAGAGFSIKLRHRDQVVVCFFGDGAANRGPVHEVMNLAAVWALPVIFVVENNQYASTTPYDKALAIESISVRASAYGMPGETVDGNDVLAVRSAAQEAVKRARKGEGPTLLENKTYRFRGHFEGDPQMYRAPAEIDQWKMQNDPLNRFERVLMQTDILTSDERQKIHEEVTQLLLAAVAFAEGSNPPQPEEALDDLWATMQVEQEGYR
jgi:pyruvate dehydrogenase E1 component alpha subunit